MMYKILGGSRIWGVCDNYVKLCRTTFAPGFWAGTEEARVLIDSEIFTIVSINLYDGIICLDRTVNPHSTIIELITEIKPKKLKIINYFGDL